MLRALVLLVFLLLSPAAGAQTELQPLDQGEASITAADLHTHLSFLASDEMKGRATGSPEAEAAALYIAERMAAHGLEPAGDSKTYENKFSALGRICRNVCGVVPGTDPSRRREFVVYGAHYDHVGLGAFGSRAPERRGEVHNGADDNASGTSSLLELAEAFAAVPAQRSILFLAFSGEELGLLGSAAWCRKPTVPLRSVVTMVNLDMIGRSRDRYLFVGGLNTGSGFVELVQEMSKPFGFKLELNGGGRGPSDFDSFYKEKVPVLSLFTAEHSEYHTPDDDVALLNIADQALITRLAYRLGRKLAEGKRPRWQEDDRQAMPASSQRGADQAQLLLGVKLGEAIPGEEGVPLLEVRRGGPAGKAGLTDQDRIVSLDGVTLESAAAVQAFLALKRPGTPLKVQILRGRRRLTCAIPLKD